MSEHEDDPDHPSNVFVDHEPCPECGSSDNLGRWLDGHAHCFGCDYREPPNEEYRDRQPKQQRKAMSADLITNGVVKSISKRKIPQEICQRYKYEVGKMADGTTVHIANVVDENNRVCAQHLRTADKDFPWIGDKKASKPFGWHLLRDDTSKIILTEGELDAMSVAIALGPKSRFVAMALTSGADGAAKQVATIIDRLEKADEVIFMLDMDEKGQAATEKAVRLLSSGKGKIAQLPLKDANEMLMAGRAAELVDAVFAAQAWKPQGVVRIGDVKQRVLEAPVVGLPYWHPEITSATLGRRMGEVIAIGAGTGVGKTDFLTQQIEFDVNKLQERVALFFFEQQPFETVRRIVGKMKGKKFHIPPNPDTNPWTQEELEEAVDELDRSDRVLMFDHFGSTDWSLIEDTIRYLYHNEGIRLFYVDHLTALGSHAEDERKELEKVMADIGGIVKELDIWICLVSHLATPDGKPHEEGGRVMIRHFKGSRAIGFWCHYMFGLERNQQSEDEDERSTTTFRVLKDRVTGQSTGRTFALGYDHRAGRLIPQEQAFDGPSPSFGGGSCF